MKSTLIQIDIKTNESLKNDFLGSVFRGWLGFILKCKPEKSCEHCPDTSKCSYFMVFKEKIEIKPYSLLSFKNRDFIRNFIKIHGNRRSFAPAILSDINDKAEYMHFGGSKYSIESLEAKNIEIPNTTLNDTTTVNLISPLHLLKNRKTEVIPSFSSLISSSVRSYNRITKYYDSESYPYIIADDLQNLGADILDFDIRTVQYVHSSIEKKSIKLMGSVGWIKYDTSNIPAETGHILKMGEVLQIGKHTTYGLGGFLINTEA
ncbi:MAG: hypothetical protein CVV34_00060 [Methanomicrobiales archaeon HGW-Methanomicrobiales-5]|nr:MAG: hypothetical protein CVV34_00060 [Methanomicrobiales archaeon HGW-Methanomicrobiales-5]